MGQTFKMLVTLTRAVMRLLGSIAKASFSAGVLEGPHTHADPWCLWPPWRWVAEFLFRALCPDLKALSI